MESDAGSNNSGDFIAIAGIVLILVGGVVTVIGALLRLSAVAFSGFVTMLVVGLLLAVLLHAEGRPGWRLFTAGLCMTILCALLAFISDLAGSIAAEWVFLVAASISGVLAVLGARSGFGWQPLR